MASILIIEDEDKIRTSLKRILELSGFDVLAASNGTEGIAIAKQHLPDLVLCDIMMPGMNGHDVVQHLSNSASTDTIPFIFLTAKSDLSEIREGMDLGADDYLTKPVKTEVLLNCIRVRLNKKEKQKQQSESQLTALRENISRSIPHELNTPLNGILGTADFLVTMPDPEVQELGSIILDSAKRLHTTITKFLVYTELEIAMQSPQGSNFFKQVEDVDLHSLIKHVATETAEKFQRASDLNLSLQPGSMTMSSFFCKKLVEELIDNAFKFSEVGTPVVIRNTFNKEYLILTIQDHGRGMKPEQIAEVGAYVQFERRIYEQQGIGLGLLIAKYIAELAGGTLTINSQSVSGTTVQVILPKQDA